MCSDKKNRKQNYRLIIFSGYNQRAVISLLRECSRLNVSVSIIASSIDDSIFLTKYKDLVFETRSDLSLDINIFESLFRKLNDYFQNESFIIAPSTESLIRLFLQYRDILANYNFVLPIVDNNTYSMLSDKIRFRNLCRNKGFDVPALYNDFDNCPSIFVAKNKYYFSSKTNKYLYPIIIHNKHEKDEFANLYDIDDFYYEEYLDDLHGESYYLLYYFFENGKIQKFSQKNLLQQADGKSIVMAKASYIHKEPVSSKYEMLFQELKFRGLIMVELRKKDGKYFMIEANPRMWGPSQLCIDSGVSMLHAFLYDYKLTETPVETTPIDGKYCWIGGIKNNLIKGKNLSVLSNEGFEPDKFVEYLKADIYRKADTMEIFESEEGL
ncbi:MAG: hypothetical protein E7271_01850 [Lachnospiraceae bacterium]|jgi:predicted ATP-grasp superfamily ATP-dependent carboligase|nr:hypothetical protein [Lachnospiraceae bacterium]